MPDEVTNLNPLRQKIGSAIATKGEPKSSELEVTKALTKETHAQLYNFANDQGQKIFDRKLPWIISVFFTTKLSDVDIHSLFETLDEQKPGRYKSSAGKW